MKPKTVTINVTPAAARLLKRICKATGQKQFFMASEAIEQIAGRIEEKAAKEGK